MTAPPLFPAWVRAELAAHPGRWRQAVAVAAASTAALALALGFQVATFPAPLLAFKGLLPSCVSRWRDLPPRLVIVAGAAVVTMLTAGVLIEVPWLLVVVFFAAISATTYLMPITQSPIRGYIVLLTLASVTYNTVFAPQTVGQVALAMAAGLAIGVGIATLTTEVGATVPPRDELGAALAAHFERVRMQLRDTGDRFRAADSPAAAGESAASPSLAAHLQLLARVRQDSDDPDLARAFVALVTAAERAAVFAAAADAISRPAVGRRYRRSLDSELGALLAALDTGLARFAAAARAPESVVSRGVVAVPHAPDWPDFAALTGALQTRQRDLTAAEAARDFDIAEAVNFNSFAQTLEGLADVLATPPQALEYAAGAGTVRARRWLPPFDPYAAQFAMKIALACVLALIVGVASHVQALETCVLNPLILAQGSYGATIRKTGLRLAGVLSGGFLAVLTVVAVMPNTDDVGTWLLVLFAVTLPSAYVALGSPRLSYLGTQTAATYMIVLVADRPAVDIGNVLWRFYGTVLGALILFGVFELVAPDYAGRQIVSRFADLLGWLRSVLPRSGRPLPPVERTSAVGDQIIGGLADVLRLADEARYEGGRSGVDPDAAVDGAGLLRRLAHRWALVRRGRRAGARPPLPAGLDAAVVAFEDAALARLERLQRLVAARHHRQRIGSRRHRQARAAAAAVAAAPVSDVDGPLARIVAGIGELHAAGATSQWPVDAARALLAEVGHLQRIAELLPRLETALLRTLLLESAAAAMPAAASARTDVSSPWSGTLQTTGGNAR